MKRAARTLLTSFLVFAVAFAVALPPPAYAEAGSSSTREIVDTHTILYFHDSYCLDMDNSGHQCKVVDFGEKVNLFVELSELFPGAIRDPFWVYAHLADQILATIQVQIPTIIQQIDYEISQIQMQMDFLLESHCEYFAMLSGYCFPATTCNVVTTIYNVTTGSDPNRCWVTNFHFSRDCTVCGRHWGTHIMPDGPFHNWRTSSACVSICIDCLERRGSDCNWASTPNPCQERCTRCGGTRSLSCDWVFEGNTQRCRRCGRSFIIWRNEDDVD